MYDPITRRLPSASPKKSLPKLAGFTLLELLLVIAIVAAMSVFSMQFYQQQALTFKVNKTALQMQQWLEAAKAYYVDCRGVWPGIDPSKPDAPPSATIALTQLLGQTPRSCGGQVVYIYPGSIDSNPWGNAYFLIPPATASSNGNNTVSVFGVGTHVGSTGTQNAAAVAVLAKRIAGRLPNATVSVQPGATSVQAYIAIPGSSATNPNQTIVLSVQTVQCTNNVCGQVPKPEPGVCPAGQKPTLHLALQQFSAFSATNYQAAIGSYAALLTPDSNNDLWHIGLQYTGPSGVVLLANGTILAIATCEATSLPMMSSPANIHRMLPFKF